MRELDLDEIHMRTLEVMDHIHHQCETHGITYYLYAGTLIGAIRHNGFIPWDDDFDICMLRDDFTKFCSIAESEHHPYFRLCNRANTRNYYFGISRYVDTRFRYISKTRGIKPVDMGIFIDIYPLDNFGNSQEEAERIKRKCIQLNETYRLYTNWKSARAWYYSLLKLPVFLSCRALYGKNFSEKIDDMIVQHIKKNTDDSDQYLGLVCWQHEVWLFEKDWFRKRHLHEFEGRSYWIPDGYDAFLRLLYGDYMELPPENERVPGHEYKIYALDENKV